MGEAGRVGMREGSEREEEEKPREDDQENNKVEETKSGLRRFLKDLLSPRLFVLKIIYCALLGGVVILWPQFTVHQQVLGLSVTQTGIFSTVVSVAGIFVPFLSGVVGDKLGNYKVILILTTLLAGIMAYLFTLVPSALVSSSVNTTDIPTDTITTTTPSTTTTNATSLSGPAVDPDLLAVTFWSYMCVRVAYGVLQTISYTLYEAAVMAEVQASGLDYGFQRAWGTLAAIGASFLSGHLVELTGGFSVIFIVSAALQVIAAALMLLLRLDFKPPATTLTRNILHLSANAEVLMFFAAMLAAGVFFGFLETYMYRYLVDLGATPVLVGLTVTVGAPFELVLTLLASFLVPLTGHAPIIMFGLLGHAIRLLGFSLLVNPWWVLGLEVLESVSNGLLATVGVMYCTQLFSLESIASFRGIFAVLYMGVGQSIGAAGGAWLQEAFGKRGAFRTLSWVALSCTIAYAVAYYILRWWRRNRKAEESPKAVSAISSSVDVEAKKEGIDNPSWVPED